MSRVALETPDGRRRGLVLLGRNATERRLAEDSLRLAASVFEHNPQGIMIADAQPRIVRVNRAFSEITGYAPVEVLGRSPSILGSGIHDEAFYAAMWEALQTSGRWSGEIWNRRRNGQIYPEWLTITAIRGKGGEVTSYIGSFADIAERKSIEAEVRRLTYTDPLTGLGNRRFLEERLDVAVAEARSASGCVALLLMGLDRFGALNEAEGLPVGDAVLWSMAKRLTEVVGAQGTLTRWNGEVFAVLLDGMVPQDCESCACTDQIMELVGQALVRPLLVDGIEVHLTAHQGLALFPRDADSAADLVRCATRALGDAKRQGPGSASTFDSGSDAEARERRHLERDLRRAVARGELSLHYQPQVDAKSGAVMGAEALLRWRHARKGWIPAGEFIPLAEESDLILQLGDFALDRACSQLADWRRSSVCVERVSVNISARQLLQPGFAERVAQLIEENGVEAGAIHLEITESVVVESRERPSAASPICGGWV